MSPQEEAILRPDRFISATEVARLLSVHRATVHRKVAAGVLPAPFRVSDRRIAFKESEIVAYMNSRERVPVAA